MQKRRIVVAIEGIDGSGKTTLINKLINELGENVTIYERTQKNMFFDKLVTTKIMRQYYMLQVPLYMFLSYKNYILFLLKRKKQIIIMDRCFLSNICYFFPQALHDQQLFKKLQFFEIKFSPEIIFILDVEPIIGQIRDSNKKELSWLQKTRNAYLKAKTELRNWITIEILDEKLSIDDKCKIILRYLKETSYGN